MAKYQIIFAKWCKALFAVQQGTVYLDDVIDGRMENNRAK